MSSILTFQCTLLSPDASLSPELLLWNVWQSTCSALAWWLSMGLRADPVWSLVHFTSSWLLSVHFQLLFQIYTKLFQIWKWFWAVFGQTGLLPFKIQFLSLLDHLNHLKLLKFLPCFGNFVVPLTLVTTHFLVMDSNIHWHSLFLLLSISCLFSSLYWKKMQHMYYPVGFKMVCKVSLLTITFKWWLLELYWCGSDFWQLLV